ncbi:SDR family NAD(P)-dependent oxidoreductase [bacterium]|nr:MAG: SDR family NAD(P)-dependent oxidoreductase [bacterium]
MSQTRITTPFGATSTAAEVIEGIDLTGKRAIVTGGASGIGTETVRALAKAGAQVTIAVRNTEAAEPVVADLIATTANHDIRIAKLDLSDHEFIGAFVHAWEGPLHILINNAGVMAIPELQATPEGWETQFATNHLGHFTLTLGLHDALAAAGNARVVAVSSSAHMHSPVVFDDIHFKFRAYDPWSAYGQSKTANILFSLEANRRWAADGITANSLMPGAIPTNLQRYIGGMPLSIENLKTTEQGAATSVLLATSPQLEGIGGRYFADCNEAKPIDHRTLDRDVVAPYALDPANAERLWEESLRLLGIN